MIVYPDINPIALQLGPIKLHWYGIMYLVGLAVAWLLARRRAAKPGSTWKPVDADDLVVFAINASELPAPKGLQPCPPTDRVASLEGNLAIRIGGQFLGCFRSRAVVVQHGLRGDPSVPQEYAFAMRLPGGPYTSEALGQFLTTVRAQWAGFNPLSREFHDRYTREVNELIRGSSRPESANASVTSIKPVLVSIDRLGPDAYSVVSLRTYELTVGGQPLKSVKVDADAVALVHSTLVRLTLLREVQSASDVADARAQINSWASLSHSSQRTTLVNAGLAPREPPKTFVPWNRSSPGPHRRPVRE